MMRRKTASKHASSSGLTHTPRYTRGSWRQEAETHTAPPKTGVGLCPKNHIPPHRTPKFGGEASFTLVTVTMTHFHFRTTFNNIVSENYLIKKRSGSSFFHGVLWGRSPHDPRGGAVTIPVRTNMTWLSTSQTTDAVADFFVSTHHGAPGVGSLVVDLPASSSHSQWRVGSTGDPQPGV